ncbi:Enoyl-CoA hydratase/carnithine racemase [Microbulbifer thermotolerans]|uniref:enoyl-CoA hydratase/isomerase family protein n=1 Tax=Microbulbifer thermotolerans TaxID=252514 RepID=UPI0008E5492F|nr:enoyl-CoA hydratase/isomerase family protein [Microbulbifer thermotolerans]SFC76134.1 Enoyl-CoA hydratase/carnithine racemase [Microbulbifer thermotolerans]
MRENRTHNAISIQTSPTGVARITLNLPPANAYYEAFLREIGDAVDTLEKNDAIRVVIIESALEKFFCAGADIKVFANNTVQENLALVSQARTNALEIENSSKIYIAQIAGHCLGGGLEIALACDFIFASEGDYRFGLPEIKLGLIPGNGGTQRLLRRIGFRAALEILLTGDTFGVAQANELGLLDGLYSRTGLREGTQNFAEELAQGPGRASTAIKRALREGCSLPLDRALALESELADSLYETADAKEGLSAFLEKRKPVFNQ